MTMEFAGHESHRKRLEYNEEIGNKMSCKIEEMWQPVCKAWYSVAMNVLENFTIQCQGELQILLKQMEMQRNTDFMIWAYNVVVLSLECI